MKLEARLTYGKVRFDQETDTHLVVTVTAPEVMDEAKRPPLCIVPLIDVSPSMEGAKMQYAKRSLIKLIDHLSAEDRCGLIAFASSASTLQKPIKCTAEAKQELKRKVQDLTFGSATNIADALLEGFRVANNMDLPSEVITRVILFTDGAANTGMAKTPKEILALVQPNIGIATVSAFGYGDDAVQDFLSDLSKLGNGNYSFVQNPDDALTAFGKELGGLLSTYATNLLIDVSPLAGHEIAQVVTDVEVDQTNTKQLKLKVSDILAGETRHFVLAVKLRSQKSALPREVNVFDIHVGYDTLDDNRRRQHSTLEAKARVQFVKDGEHQDRVDSGLDHIVGLAQVVRAQLEAEEHAKNGNFAQAQNLMNNTSILFDRRGLAGLGNVARNIGGTVGSRAQYGQSASYRASVTRGATRGCSGTYSSMATQDLQSLGVVMANSSQEAVAAAFTDAATAFTDAAAAFTDAAVAAPAYNGLQQHTTVAPQLTVGEPFWVESYTIGDPSAPGTWVSSQSTVRISSVPVAQPESPTLDPVVEPKAKKRKTRKPARKQT